MKHLSSGSGFSLVELLTVIAIIAILASIIFPVMSAVKNRANESSCMSNLKQIAIGVQMFKTDNRKYPGILGSMVKNTDGSLHFGTGGTPQRFESTPDAYLFSEYVKTIGLFHCRASSVSSSTDVMDYQTDLTDANSNVSVYAYDSYDAGIMARVSPRAPTPGTSWGRPRHTIPRTGPQAPWPSANPISITVIIIPRSSRFLRAARKTPRLFSRRIMPGSFAGEIHRETRW